MWHKAKKYQIYWELRYGVAEELGTISELFLDLAWLVCICVHVHVCGPGKAI